MTRRVALWAISVALLLLAVALAGCGGGDSTTSADTTTAQTAPPPPPPPPPAQEQVRIEVGENGVAGGPVRATVKQGSRVVLVVHSALADEIHLHGYDLSRDVEAGGTARIAFKATIPGTFEIELESRGLQIGELMVRP